MGSRSMPPGALIVMGVVAHVICREKVCSVSYIKILCHVYVNPQIGDLSALFPDFPVPNLEGVTSSSLLYSGGKEGM